MSDSFNAFRKLLIETYLFPANYTHKFIGKNTERFRLSVLEFEKNFVGLKKTCERQSANSAHVALTYDFLAGTAEDIVELAKKTHEIDDLLYVL